MKTNQYMGQFLETIDLIDKQADEAIRNGKKAKRVAGIIMSNPGIGKTSTVNLWTQYKGYNLVTLTPSTYSVDDILGLDVRVGDEVMGYRMERIAPSWFHELADKAQNGRRNVLFIDEISATTDILQPPLFRLVFDRVLATKRLPENTLVIAAGNYSEDLNNAFKMTAPLVNRFMILNLLNTDVSYRELLEDEEDIDEISYEDIPEFLGLTSPSRKKYDFNRFKEWVGDNLSEFTPGKAEYVEGVDFGGLLGFISPRAFKFSMIFAEAYMSRFNDPIWMRIVGDTLGMSKKREGNAIRTVLMANELEFLAMESKEVKTFRSLRDEALSMGLTDDVLKGLNDLVRNATLSNTTSADLKYFSDIVSKYPTNETLDYLNRTLIKKLS